MSNAKLNENRLTLFVDAYRKYSQKKDEMTWAQRVGRLEGMIEFLLAK